MLFLQLSLEYGMHTASCVYPKNKFFTRIRILAKHWQFDSKHCNPSEKRQFRSFVSLKIFDATKGCVDVNIFAIWVKILLELPQNTEKDTQNVSTQYRRKFRIF